MKPLPKTESGREWRFRLTSPFTVDLGFGFSGFHEFYDDERRWGVLRDDVLTIERGYSWDGASPCFKVFGRWVGTPTPPSMLGPSLTHDFLYQFSGLRCAPWNVKQADMIFYNLMRDYGFPLKGTYHGAVHLLGSAYRRFRPLSDSVSCHPHTDTP
jgi:hypothetical protein